MSAIRAALEYIRAGFLVVPIPRGAKKAVRKNWQHLRLREQEVSTYFDSISNIGVLLGRDGLTDIDCDCRESIVTAQALLPQTTMVFGRDSKPGSHYVYRADAEVITKKFEDPIDNTTVLEIRGLTKNRAIGLQTVVPPSAHPCGEIVRFEPGCGATPSPVSARLLVRRAGAAAAGALLAKYWPPKGRHLTMLAFVGALARLGWSEGEARDLCRAIYVAVPTHDPSAISRVESEVRDTYEKFHEGAETTGFSTFITHVNKAVAALALKWLGVDPSEEKQHKKRSKEAEPAEYDVVLDVIGSIELFHAPDRKAWATVHIGRRREALMVRSPEFKNWLVAATLRKHGRLIRGERLQGVLDLLESRALFEGPCRETHLRIAAVDDQVFLDLGSETGEIIRIASTGWSVQEGAPVAFRRSRGMQALPLPQPGGHIESLRRFVNVAPGNDWILFISYVLGCFQPSGPYPVLVLVGEQGTAKSTVTRMLRDLIDPAMCSIRAAPRNERDLMLAANANFIVAFDNLSGLQPWLSDALCRLSTGAGFGTRELFSDREETLIEARRPVILNGIENMIERPDLADRSIALELRPISDSSRIPEVRLSPVYDGVRPFVLGAILNAVACGLRDWKLVDGPAVRMADFAMWCQAALPGLGVPSEAFERAFANNRLDSVALTIDADPFASAILSLVRETTSWSGSATELLELLEKRERRSARSSDSWPKSASALGARLRRWAPAVRQLGITVEHDRTGQHGTRRIRLIANICIAVNGVSGPHIRP